MRQTVNLDAESQEQLDALAQENNVSKSQVIRDALDHYNTVAREWQSVDREQLEWYVKLLRSSEHRIIDIDHINSFLDAIGSPSEELLAEWNQIGHKHGLEWAGQFDSVEKKLRVLEYCNWYTITTISEGQYTLTTESEAEASLMCAFLEGECAELGLDVAIRQVDQKILVTDESA